MCRMTSRSRPLIALLVLVAACSDTAPPLPASQSSSVSDPRDPVEAPVASPMSSAAADLDALDGRAPVPLLPMMANHQKQNMRDHLAAVQEVVAALARDDYAGVERAAARIGYSEQMGETCTRMGAGAPGFTAQALEFHRAAEGISAAAREADRMRVLEELGATLATCTACHAEWKQQVVDEATWQELTSSLAATHDPLSTEH